MGPGSRDESSSDSLSQARQADRHCVRFEAAWKTGSRPRINEFLVDIPPAEWPDLLRELLILDLHYRRKLGESPTLEDYRAQYPALDFEPLADLFTTASQPMPTSLTGATGQFTSSDSQTSNGKLPRIRYLGDYELVAEIARGGMGVVYKARQISLNRIVAVKMILAGLLATKADHDRFHSEAQAAALLDHPNIVPIFEVGEHEGQHYFSMGYVDGQSLAARLAEGPLPPKEAAELVAIAAGAVEYAHRQGVIHRDIKPSNILIDSKGRPRVTDFGLAKRVGAPGGNPLVGAGRGSDLTATGQVLGTPSYMPPEQAAGQINAIGPAADVYALGALLYTTLAGRPPFQAATQLETLRQVIEQEPVPLRQLNAAVPRDLETIVLKCLEKSVPRRYTSAQALTEELRRYLEGRPILARPVGRVEHAWRWCRRQPVVAGLIAAVAVTLVAGTIVSSIFAIKALEERDRANGNAELADKNAAEAMTNAGTAERKAKEAEEQKNRAEAGETLATKRLAQVAAEKKKAEDEKQIAQSVQNFLQYKLLGQADSRIQADALLWSGGFSAEAKENPTIRELLDRAAKELAPERIDANFPNQPLVQAAILQTVGRTYHGVGGYEQAIGFLDRSATLYREHLGPDHPETLASMNNLALAYAAAGKLDLALPLGAETLKLTKANLGSDHPYTLISMISLAWVYQEAGKLDLALPLFEEALNLMKAKLGPDHPYTLISMNGLAQAYSTAGKLDLAVPLCAETLKLRKAKLGPEHPETLTSMCNLAQAYLSAGKLDLALPLCAETLKLRKAKLGPDHPETLTSMSDLAQAYLRAGKLDLALPLYEETLKLMKAKLGPEHPGTLTSMGNLAEAYWQAKQLDKSIPMFEDALKRLQRKLGRQHPQTLQTAADLGVNYTGAGRLAEALPLIEETLKLRKATLGPEHPATLYSMYNLAGAYQSAGKLDLAVPLFEETLKLQKAKLGPEHPDTLLSMDSLAGAYWEMQQLDKSIPMFEETLKRLQRKLGRQHPQTLQTAVNLGVNYKGAGRLAEALPLIEETLKLQKETLGPEHPDTLQSMDSLAGAYQSAGKRDLALPLFEETLKLRKAKLGPDHPDTLRSTDSLANAYGVMQQFDKSIPMFEDTLKRLQRKLGRQHPQTLRTAANLGRNYAGAGRLVEALPLIEETLKLQKVKLGPQHSVTLNTMNDLASAYQATGKLELALPLLEESLKLRKAKFGPDHPDTLANMNNLAGAYWQAKQLDKSILIFEDTLKRKQTKLGRQHPETLRTAANLGVNYKDAGRLVEALPLLEEGYRAAKKYPTLRWVGAQLLDGYVRAGKTEQAATLAKELLADARRQLPKDSPQLAGQLAPTALLLLQAKAFAEAEPLLRECRSIREKTQPDEWTTFTTKSMLGGALLGQKKYAEAEPLLLAGYEGMKWREAKIPLPGEVRLTEALERLVQLDEALEKKDEAAKWRKELKARKEAQERLKLDKPHPQTSPGTQGK